MANPNFKVMLDRFGELDITQRKATAELQEWKDLKESIEKLRKYFPDDFRGYQGDKTWAMLIESPPKVEQTTQASISMRVIRAAYGEAMGFVEEILKEGQPKHARELLKAVEARGWKSPEDDSKRAIKGFYNALNIRTDTFKNIGANVWTLADKTQES